MVSTMTKLGRTAAIAIFFIYNTTLFYLVVFLHATAHIFAENGPMEMSQALLLTTTAVIFLISWTGLEKHHKFVLLSCSLLCLTFLFRELDVADFDIPHFLIVMGSGTGRNIILSTAWVCIAIGAFLNWQYYRGKLTLYFFSKTALLLMTGAGFLLVGAFFDHEVIKVSYYKFYEELAELNGYYFLLLGALVSRASLQDIANRSSR
ncbi:MAG: hypothetical protein RI601_03230 [Desulfurivibrionaceae bacterium]|nr:hypothetical protein [Desulfurivibrionaceae bacterium]